MLKEGKKILDNGLLKVALLLGLGLLLVFFGLSDKDEAGSVSAESEEERVAALCSYLDGVGECRVIINYEVKSEGYGREDTVCISGIAVVCEGGDSTDVKRKVTGLLSSLYGIGSNRITVEKMGKY